MGRWVTTPTDVCPCPHRGQGSCCWCSEWRPEMPLDTQCGTEWPPRHPAENPAAPDVRGAKAGACPIRHVLPSDRWPVLRFHTQGQGCLHSPAGWGASGGKGRAVSSSLDMDPGPRPPGTALGPQWGRPAQAECRPWAQPPRPQTASLLVREQAEGLSPEVDEKAVLLPLESSSVSVSWASVINHHRPCGLNKRD